MIDPLELTYDNILFIPKWDFSLSESSKRIIYTDKSPDSINSFLPEARRTLIACSFIDPRYKMGSTYGPFLVDLERIVPYGGKSELDVYSQVNSNHFVVEGADFTHDRSVMDIGTLDGFLSGLSKPLSKDGRNCVVTEKPLCAYSRKRLEPFISSADVYACIQGEFGGQSKPLFYDYDVAQRIFNFK